MDFLFFFLPRLRLEPELLNSGLENLSGIPGSIGAAPIQNIGAYGSEVSDFIEEVICFDMESNNLVSFTNEDCKFSYRQSIFQDKDSLIVVKVKFKLTKDFFITYSSQKNCKICNVICEFSLTNEAKNQKWFEDNL